jgi:hypothetical protein
VIMHSRMAVPQLPMAIYNVTCTAMAIRLRSVEPGIDFLSIVISHAILQLLHFQARASEQDTLRMVSYKANNMVLKRNWL